MTTKNFKMWKLFCEICNYNKLVEDLDSCGLVEYKRSAIQGRLPTLDTDKKEINTPKSIEPIKNFKCPKCGRIIKPKQITDTPNLDKEKRRLKKFLERD